MILTTPHLAQLTEIAKSAALMAGAYIQSQFDTAIVKERKTGGDSRASHVVTEVDFKAQEIILNQLAECIHTFDLGLLTEEATDDHSRLQKDYFWCIDPLDGTLPFTERRTGYAVSIALISKTGNPVVGVAYLPDLKTCYAAYTGSGVYRNDQMLVRHPVKAETLHFYMDQSFLVAPYYEWVKTQMETLIETSEYTQIEYHSDFGGVRNAIGVMESDAGCYFKFPKQANGCGSIWDYAATCLFMQESKLSVSNAQGTRLHLNDLETTFMNRVGILYATDQRLAEWVVKLGQKWNEMT
ncbi:MAG: inositol monophosphatase family protein [Bacteroidota bacterium]